MSIADFLQQLDQTPSVSFNETMQLIADYYDYTPTEFSNGLGEEQITNAAGSNEGSCKIFAFASLNQLTPQQTLPLFGDYYRVDVLQDPNGSGHQNIRLFMKYGWDGIQFKGEALTLK